MCSVKESKYFDASSVCPNIDLIDQRESDMRDEFPSHECPLLKQFLGKSLSGKAFK